MTCPGPDRFESWLYGETSEPQEAAIRHAFECEACGALLRTHERVPALLAAWLDSESPEVECLGVSQIAAYLDDGLDPGSRDAAEAHLATCARCVARLVEAGLPRIRPGAAPDRVAAIAEPSGGPPRFARRGPPNWLWAAAALVGAAALALWLASAPPPSGPEAPTMVRRAPATGRVPLVRRPAGESRRGGAEGRVELTEGFRALLSAHATAPSGRTGARIVAALAQADPGLDGDRVRHVELDAELARQLAEGTAPNDAPFVLSEDGVLLIGREH